jgi:phosphoribosylamine---glycine ligase
VPIVLKFDGLAAGKGVAVCSSQQEAYDFIDEVMEKRVFGAGNLIVESCLTGPEVSVFVSIVDDQYQILMAARDYKRIFDADQGANTGGMGAVASRELIQASALKQIEESMIVPTVKGLQNEGLSYRGFLYFGVMLTPEGPQMLEYNCRFGDPEAEAVMPMIRGSLPDYLKSAAQGNLNQGLIQFAEGWSVCVILASAGYPASSRNGDEIQGIPENTDLTRVYHCGTRWNKDKKCFETQGGRVLAAVASGNTRQVARDRAYAINQKISFAGQQMRTDIATLHFD